MATTQTDGMTWEQFRALPDSDEYRHTELIDGVLVHKFAQRVLGAWVVNAGSRRHQWVAARLWQELEMWTRAEPGRGEPAHEPGVKITERLGYIPDVA